MLRPIVALLLVAFAVMANSAYSLSGAVGRGTVRDDKNYNDKITITMIGVPAAPRDKVYEAWLVTDKGKEQFSLGNLKVEGDGTVRHAVTRDENYFARYNKITISLEPRGKRDPKQAGSTVFASEIPLSVMTQLRSLLVHSPDAPNGAALAIGVRTQSSLMLKHINSASAAASAANGDLGKVKENAEAIVNVIEGAKGPHYGNLNGDQNVQNPGDGYGLLTYVDQATSTAGQIAESGEATPDMKAGAGQVQISAGNVGSWAGQVRDTALTILQAGSIDEVKPLLEQMSKNGMAALNGVDANDNGLVEPIEGEGGATTAYVSAQNIGWFEIKATEPAIGQGKSAASPSQAGQGDSNGQEEGLMPTGWGLAPILLIGVLAGTSALAAMAFLWVRSKTEITRR